MFFNSNRVLIALSLCAASTFAHAEWPVFIQKDDYNTRGRDIKADASGNIYVAGEIFSDGPTIFLSKLDRFGSVLWNQTYGDGLHAVQRPTLAVSPAGDSYVLATDHNGSRQVTLKFDSTGTMQWERRRAPVGNHSLDANEVALMPNGGCVTTSSVSDSHDQYYILVSGYGPNGSSLFESEYGLASSVNCRAVDMAVDDLGDTYIGASNRNGATGAYEGSFVLKVTPNGTVNWTRPVANTAGLKRLRLDSTGNVLVLGYFSGIKRSYSRALVQKVNASGDELFRAQLAVSQKDLYAYDMVVDHQNNAILSGTYYDSVTSLFGHYVAKVDSTGKKVWSNLGLSGASTLPTENNLNVDDENNIFVGSVFTGSSGTTSNFAMQKFSTTGKRIWVRIDNSDPSRVGFPLASIYSSVTNHVYMTGYAFNGATSRSEAYTVRY